MNSLQDLLVGVVGVVAMLATSPAAAGPLHDAAFAGDEIAIQRLLDAGTDINDRDEAGATAIFSAAYGSHNKTMEYLLQRRADHTLRDNKGLTVLHAAAFAGDAEAVAYFIGTDGPGFWPIDIDDHENELGATPLFVAAGQNRGNIVAYLLLGGADIEIADVNGYTALTNAGRLGYEQVAAILLRRGAKCQEIDPAWLAECLKRREEMGLK